MVAMVTMTVTATVAFYTDARCPSCNRRVMSVPGYRAPKVIALASDLDRSGLGRVVGCSRCKGLCEVIEHDG